MRRSVAIANAAGVAATLGLAFLAPSPGAPAMPGAAARPDRAGLEAVALPGGRLGLRDATGHVVELRPYGRILSASTVADRLLQALAEPDRIVGVTAFGRASPWAYQQADKPTLVGIDDVEAVLSLAPDLVLLNSFGQASKVARLRERGVEVFDLGEMRGADMLVRDIHVV